MPEICRFFGIIISFYWRDHNPPHIHFSYGDYECSISVLDRRTTDPIPLNELVKLIVSKDNSKNTDKAKDGNARKRIERGIKYGTLKKDELKNIYLKTEE